MEILKNFTNCWSWPYTSYAVTCYTHETRSQHYNARNSKGKHAEDAAIKHLEDLLARKKLGSPVIKIYLSNSPCQDCSRKILNFLGTTTSKYSIDLKVELVFSSLYRVRRPSNEENPHYPRRLPDFKDHEAQVEGLKKLHRHGVILRTFTPQDWRDLVMTLDVDYFDISGRKKDDDLLRSDFKKIMDHNPTSLGRKQKGKSTSFSQETSQALKPKTGPVDTNKPVSKQGNSSIASSPVTPQLESIAYSPVTPKLESIAYSPVSPKLESISSSPVTPKLESIAYSPVTPKLESIAYSPVTPKLESIASSSVTAQLESLHLTVKNTFSNTKEKLKDQHDDDAMVAKCHQTETDRRIDVMTAKDKCDNDVVTKDKRVEVIVAKYKCDHMRNSKDKYDEGMKVKDKCGDLMTENDKCSDVVIAKDKCDKVLRTTDTCNDVMTAKDTWDNVKTARGKYNEGMTAKDKWDSMGTAEDTRNAKDDCDDAIFTKRQL